jgi:phosphoglycolate phosphatase
MTIYFDLDGTLLDVTSRHYSVYVGIRRGWRIRPLSRAKYWSLKREATAPEEILSRSGAVHRGAEFSQSFVDRIERREYLEKDTLFPNALQMLQGLACRHGLILATLRRSRPGLLWQLGRLQLLPLFQLVLNEPNDRGWVAKAKLIARHHPAEAGCLVGDTEADVLAARSLRLASCAVTWGLRSRRYLEQMQPDLVVEGFEELERSFPEPETSLSRHGIGTQNTVE